MRLIFPGDNRHYIMLESKGRKHLLGQIRTIQIKRLLLQDGGDEHFTSIVWLPPTAVLPIRAGKKLAVFA